MFDTQTNSLQIVPATDGGYTVIRPRSWYREGDAWVPPLYAGTLTMCLKYIENHYTKKKAKNESK